MKTLPDRIEFENLYAISSQTKLTKIYKCGKKTIREWIDYFGLSKRSVGGGNNRKYSFTKEYLQYYVDFGYSNKEIIMMLNITGLSSLNRLLRHYNIKRIKKNSNTTEYQKYQQKARRLTEKVFVDNFSDINPNKYIRTLCGVSGGYQLDHKISIRECFDSNITVEECASVSNLQMLTWKENLNKRKFNNKGMK